MTLKTLANIDLSGKKVLLRSGFDVPIENGRILDTRRIHSGLPTIEYCLSHGATQITIINHLGRPGGKVVSELTNLPVKNYLFSIISDNSRIEVLENLRFYPGEEANNIEFSKKLAFNHDIFIQDAFNTLHESHASIIGIPKYLPSVAGLLVQKEIKVLNSLLHNPPEPFVVIMGGKKIETKLPVISVLKGRANLVLVGGLIANEIINKSLDLGDRIILPIDSRKDEAGIIRDIGPKTVDLFKEHLDSAKTVFWNGSLGMTENAQFAQGSHDIAFYLSTLTADVYIGGGDTSNIVDHLGLTDKMKFISSGGGASLLYVAGQPLPGLEPLMKVD